MYSFAVSNTTEERLKGFARKCPSIISKLDELTTNPLARASQTGIPAIGAYYVNAGRYAIIFDIDTAKSVVTLHAVRERAYLHKLLIGRI